MILKDICLLNNLLLKKCKGNKNSEILGLLMLQTLKIVLKATIIRVHSVTVIRSN